MCYKRIILQNIFISLEVFPMAPCLYSEYPLFFFCKWLFKWMFLYSLFLIEGVNCSRCSGTTLPSYEIMHNENPTKWTYTSKRPRSGLQIFKNNITSAQILRRYHILLKWNKRLDKQWPKRGLDKQCRPRSDCFWRSSLIRVFPVCYSDQHFVNSSFDSQHFSWEQKEKSVKF